MTRIVGGIFSDAVVDNGFFITDAQADLLSEWLTSYANALEKTWKNKGSEGDPKIQKFTMVRSFAAGVERARKAWGESEVDFKPETITDSEQQKE